MIVILNFLQMIGKDINEKIIKKIDENKRKNQRKKNLI